MVFDAREATISSVHNALYSGQTTCKEVVLSFLARIEALNPSINAIITLNPNALASAIKMDELLATGKATGRLFGIPVLLKDNFDTFDMPTTAGCLALADSRPTEDAPTVRALRREKAIILGKANLHELALEGLSVSSLGGQTINPFDHSRTPGGSSGGSAAAVAMSFCVFATGTDTVNSLRSPASANSLFSCRPTRGLITRTGVVPVSRTQDAVGPIARNVMDVSIALSVMRTAGSEGLSMSLDDICEDYSERLSELQLHDMRFGLLEGLFDHKSPDSEPVNKVMQVAVDAMQTLGATIVLVSDTIFDARKLLAELDTQRFEYRENMNRYLQRESLGGRHPATLNELYETGDFLVIPSQFEYVQTALSSSTAGTKYRGIQARIEVLAATLHETFRCHKLNALIYPEQKNLVVKLGSPSQSGRNGILAALTGFPVVTVPIGFSTSSEEAAIGVPIGMEVMGMPFSEESLLQIAYQLEIHMRARRSPVDAGKIIEVGNLDTVPVVLPDRRNIPAEYPLGTFA